MKKLFKISFSLFLSALVFTSCVEEVDPSEGPKYVTVSPDEFSMVENLSSNAVNGKIFIFVLNPAEFTAKFNMDVTWTLRINGLTSGAIKEFKGTSSEITIDNSTWKGDSDGFPFFQSFEKFDIELEVLGVGIVDQLDGTSATVIDPYSDKYILISDFDNNPQSAVSDFYPYFDNDQDYDDNIGDVIFDNDFDFVMGVTTPSGYASLDNIDQPIDKLSSTEQPLAAMQGEGYLHVEGIDGNGVSSFFVGGARSTNYGGFMDDFRERGWITTELDENSIAADSIQMEKELDELADNLYFNVYINGNGSRTTRVDLELREIIPQADFKLMYPESGVTNDVEQDKLTRSVDINWDGWRLISIKMSSMTWHPQENAGNKIWEWEKFMSVAVGVLAGNEGAQGDAVDASFDYMTLSYGEPFNQKVD